MMATTIRRGIAVLAVGAMVNVALAGDGEKTGKYDHDKTKHSKAYDQQCEKEWKEVVQQIKQDGITLEEAIAKATDKTGGTAISARVLTASAEAREYDRYPDPDPRMSGQDQGMHRDKDKDKDKHGDWDRDDKDRGQHDKDRMGRSAQSGQHGQKSEYCIEVVCRTQDGAFKLVSIDGLQGNIKRTSEISETRYLASNNFRDNDFKDKDRERMSRGHKDLATNRLVKASTLENSTVKSRDNQELGHIADLAVDPQSGRIPYAAISFGGWLEMGDKLVAVSLDELDIQSEDRITLNVTKSQMKKVQGFDQDDWPTRPNASFVTAQALTGNTDRDDRDEQMQRITRVKKASDLIGMEIKNRQDEDLGSVENLYVDPNESRVCYAVVSHGGWLGMGDELLAVPWESLNLNPDGDGLVLNISKDRLKNAPVASKKNSSDWTDKEWIVSVYRFYDVEPYWEEGHMERNRRSTSR